MQFKPFKSVVMLAILLAIGASLSACSNTSVYGSVGVSAGTGFNSHSSSNRRLHGSISVGGRIR